MGYKSDFDYHKRKNESSRIIAKYPDRIPVICERGNDKIVDIDKKKYLVPSDLTLGQFIYVIRKRIKLDSNQALFVTINGILEGSSTVISNLYETHKDDDGFLYILYTSENTFG